MLSVYSNWTAVLQHDPFESDTQYTVKLVLHELIINKKVISTDLLDYSLQSMAYDRGVDGKSTEIDIDSFFSLYIYIYI